MPIITEVRLRCDDCGHEPKYADNSLEAGTDDVTVIRGRAIRIARQEGFSVTDRGVFCGSSGRCNFDKRWADYRAARGRVY